METINNLASAASKAVWGEQKEPVSGVQGDTSKGEPYDAGNLETPAQEKKIDYDSTTGSSSLNKTDNVVGRDAPQTSSSTGNTPSFHDLTTSSRDDTTNLGRDTTTTTTTDRDNTTSLGRDTTTTTSALGRQDNDTASREDRVSGGHKDTSAGQNDTRDPEEARTDSTKKQDLDTNTPGTSKASDLKGPGPRPVETVAKENGGDAGNVSSSSSSERHSENQPAGRSENQPGNQSESHLQNKPQEQHESTSEEVVHASGFAADGGDFDASRPGAGQEADRLLDEKRQHGGNTGLPEKKSHSEGHGLGHHGSSSSHGHDEKEKEKDKPSLGERIKAKLHKH